MRAATCSLPMLLVFVAVIVACSNDDGASPVGDAGIADAAAGDAANPDATTGCALTANTTETTVVNGGCAVRQRDTSPCAAERTALGLSGFWLKFSCRVTLTKTAGAIGIASDGQPDYPSNYFGAADSCHRAYTPAGPNPNKIAAHPMTLSVPLTPDTTSGAMQLGAVGVALNGVAIFDNQAAPGDDIFRESASFDECQGHPTERSLYHYHSEPYSISFDDAAFIGVLRDGYPLYGRRDSDGSYPTLDAAGGHQGPTADDATTHYHYHVNQQTSTAPGTTGDKVWFLTTGRYAGKPGTCSGC